jgi:hypothetical protein
VPKIVWVLLSIALAAVVVGLTGAALLIADDSSGDSASAPITETGSTPQPLQLPLTDDPQALTLARNVGPVLVGLAARPDRPVEVAAVNGERPILRSTLVFLVDGKGGGSGTPCGRACSRLDTRVLDGRRHTLEVLVPRQASVKFELPAQLPPSGAALFRTVERTMGSLRSYRYRERLTSGVGGVTAFFEAQAPDRLRFRTETGFRSVIVGNSRWDFREGRWERSSFSRLSTSSFMWDGAHNARVLGQSRVGGRPVQVLSVFDFDPVPAWFRLQVDSSGRVLQAQMLAPSHFMDHRYRDFNGPITVEPPK